MADALIAYLRAASTRSFALGTWDCGRFVAGWVKLRLGAEPGAEFVGRYSTPFGLARLLKRRGGLVAHFDQCLGDIGVSRTETPRRGDVAVVTTPEGPTGAIMVSPTMSAALSEKGFRVRPLLLLAAWRI